jgi:hypothetical protein
VSNVAPAGWYPDPWGQSAQRFWDGTAWTPHLAHPASATSGRRPQLPAATPTGTAALWLIALLPLLGTVSVLLVRVDPAPLVDYARRVDELTRTGQDASGVPFQPFSIFGPGLVIAEVVSLLTVAAIVVLAYRDHRRLTQVGVVRPFHWAWAFLGSIVYVIGRTVVTRTVAPHSSRAPMWTSIAVNAVGSVVALVWSASWMLSTIHQLALLD